MFQSHFCSEHQTKFYRNERQDNLGNIKVWYYHKLKNAQGFCVEKDQPLQQSLLHIKGGESATVSPSRYMLMCNAMNNAVALAANGKIQLDQIGAYYKKILSESIKV